ncbi:[F-actin]-monooxygenase MICAL1 [Phytophthora citrophthora]|uniref:[F-actin]-monooxygenase MICAL1 n=1 Tax=Phytophthora citrophthora TaxID=4793 RepID=A0AAD9LKT7_9STRA|nr:[F-actin]-monooxygenase MICAL1 [Phytophthora citrophthora]
MADTNKSKYSMDRRLAIHNPLDRPRAMDRHVAYVGEGLIDPNGLNSLDNMDIDIDKSPGHRREVLDHLAMDVGEKYLDDIYKENGTDDVAETSISSARVRSEKELAWLKVRQLLIEEEAKASTQKRHTRSISRVEYRGESDDSCDTVKLMDSMAQCPPHPSQLYLNNKPKPEADPMPTQTFASRLAQFLGAGSTSDSESTSSKSSSSGVPPTRWQLLAILEQVTKTCQRMEISDASLARVSAHLNSIDQIVREDIATHQRRAQRISSTQLSNDSNDSSDTYSVVDTPTFYNRAGVSSTVRNSFKAFADAQDLYDTLTAFNTLTVDCGLEGVKLQEPWHMYYHIRDAVYSKLGFRQKQLFKLLDVKFALDVYRRRPCVTKRTCIVGAGPVGLRAAVELALLGGHVSILEKRTKFSRENMLHLWPWVVQDLAAIGAKILFKNFCKSKTYFHVSTRQLQVVLLKVALLVGVKVYSATGFLSIESPNDNDNPFYSIKTEPQIPVAEYTAVLGATGTNDLIAETAGITRFVFSRNESLGIVCYFPNLETTDEMKTKEFSWTTQLKHPMLNKLRECDIDLENIVYFRGEMHYLVMTPKRQNLLLHGVVRENHPDSKDLVRKENIDHTALDSFVKNIVRAAGIARKTDFSRVNLLDFSELTRADKAANIITSQGKKLYVGLIGDSLLEPVWHEGVGTCRGFLSALDGAWMVAQIGRKTDERILSDRQAAYQMIQRLSGNHRDEMQKNVRKYTVDPKSRYKFE